jgi:hypothetical protein
MCYIVVYFVFRLMGKVFKIFKQAKYIVKSQNCSLFVHIPLLTFFSQRWICDRNMVFSDNTCKYVAFTRWAVVKFLKS